MSTTDKPVYNQLSQKYKEEIGWNTLPPRGSKVTFRVLGGSKTVRRRLTDGSTEPAESYKAGVFIPNTDWVYDPYAEGGPKLVQIAAVRGDNPANYQFEQLHFNRQSKLQVTIADNEPHKMHILNYLRASNFNRSNPHARPHPSTGFIFEEVKTQLIDRNYNLSKKELAQATLQITDMSDVEVIAQIKTLKLPMQETADANRSTLLKYIEAPENLKRFFGTSVDVRIPMKETIEKALKEEIIVFKDDSKAWHFFDTQKHMTSVTPGVDKYDHLIDFFTMNQHGATQYEFIKERLANIESKRRANDLSIELEKMSKKKEKTQ